MATAPRWLQWRRTLQIHEGAVKGDSQASGAVSLGLSCAVVPAAKVLVAFTGGSRPGFKPQIHCCEVLYSFTWRTREPCMACAPHQGEEGSKVEGRGAVERLIV